MMLVSAIFTEGALVVLAWILIPALLLFGSMWFLNELIGPTGGNPYPGDLNPSPHRPDGGVYLIKCGDKYKIGKSRDFNRRTREFRQQLPERPEVIHKIRCSPEEATRLERRLHREYSHKRGHGEWFSLSDEDVRAFKNKN